MAHIKWKALNGINPQSAQQGSEGPRSLSCTLALLTPFRDLEHQYLPKTLLPKYYKMSF